MIKNIILDVDETLVETNKARNMIFDYLVQKYFDGLSGEGFSLSFKGHIIKELEVFKAEPFMTFGISPYDIFFHRNLKGYIGEKNPDEIKFRILEKTFSDLSLGYEKELAVRIIDDLEENWLGFFEAIQGSSEVLDKLRKSGYNLYVLTDGFNEVQLPRVKHCGLDEYFCRLVASEELGIGKGSERAFLRLMKQEAMLPSETIMIGDNIRTDYNADKVGITAILFDRYDKCKNQSIRLIGSLEEVFRFL